MEHRPGYREIRIVPANAALARGMVHGVNLVQHVRGLITQDTNSMGKARGNPQEPPIQITELHPDAASKGAGIRADIDRYVPDAPTNYAYKFALSRAVLKVKPSQHAWGRPRMIVLNELRRDERFELLGMESLDEEPPGVPVEVQLHKLESVKLEWANLHKCSGVVSWDERWQGLSPSMNVAGWALQSVYTE